MATTKKTKASPKKAPAKKAPKSSAAQKTKAKASPAKASGVAQMSLPAMLDIAATHSFFSELKALVESEPESIIADGAEVKRITTPCVQLLLALSKTMDEGKQFGLAHPSDVMKEVFADLGLTETLGTWEASAKTLSKK